MSNLYFDPGPKASGQKVMLATTVYDCPDASYTFSIARSREALTVAGIQSAYLLLQGNCHVDDGRNSVVADFLTSDCTDLIFLDADVSWEPESLVELCQFDTWQAHMDSDAIIGGVYPYRREGGGKEKMPVRNLPGKFVPDDNGLLEAEGLPTGFMRIPRIVIEDMCDLAETFIKNGKKIYVLFERDIFEGGRRGGDIAFCMKWREMGGKLFAAAELRLGHAGKQVIKDTLGASLRRQVGLTLEHVAKQVRDGRESEKTYWEAVKVANNPWGAQIDVLSLAVLLARKANGPILEIGSGLSTVLMAAANPDQTIWAVEHSQEFAYQTEKLARSAGVTNIALVTCGLKNGWYDLADDMADMPARFAFALVDGPPRQDGDRMKFFDVFGDSVTVIAADDADDPAYLNKMREWAESRGKNIDCEQRAAVITPATMALATAE